jgi:hypothetical protein
MWPYVRACALYNNKIAKYGVGMVVRDGRGGGGDAATFGK